jgi:negative regulator of sigma E activity
MRDDELDRMIDAGLSTYAEPRAGLEQRVMATVVAKQEAHIVLSQVSESRPGAPRVLTIAGGKRASERPAWRMWVVGLAAAACVLTAVTVGVRRIEAPQWHNQEAVNSTPAPVVSHPAAPEARHETAVRVGMKRGAHRSVEARGPRLPKKAVFPTPQPLSPEMQALARFAARAPEAQRRQLIEAQAKLDAPITIAPLKIAPLEIAKMDGD